MWDDGRWGQVGEKARGRCGLAGRRSRGRCAAPRIAAWRGGSCACCVALLQSGSTGIRQWHAAAQR